MKLHKSLKERNACSSQLGYTNQKLQVRFGNTCIYKKNWTSLWLKLFFIMIPDPQQCVNLLYDYPKIIHNLFQIGILSLALFDWHSGIWENRNKIYRYLNVNSTLQFYDLTILQKFPSFIYVFHYNTVFANMLINFINCLDTVAEAFWNYFIFIIWKTSLGSW